MSVYVSRSTAGRLTTGKEGCQSTSAVLQQDVLPREQRGVSLRQPFYSRTSYHGNRGVSVYVSRSTAGRLTTGTEGCQSASAALKKDVLPREKKGVSLRQPFYSRTSYHGKR